MRRAELWRSIRRRKYAFLTAIAELRAEISRAKREGEGQDVRFAAKEIEVELSIDFGWTAEATGGASKWIPFVEFSATGGVSGKFQNKVRLTLEIHTDGDPSRGLIGDETRAGAGKHGALVRAEVESFAL